MMQKVRPPRVTTKVSVLPSEEGILWAQQKSGYNQEEAVRVIKLEGIGVEHFQDDDQLINARRTTNENDSEVFNPNDRYWQAWLIDRVRKPSADKEDRQGQKYRTLEKCRGDKRSINHLAIDEDISYLLLQ